MTRPLAYYNEIDAHAAQWLRNLIGAGMIAPGEVDERDIRDVAPDELAGFSQCHFFAGIGGWSRALRIAGWPDDKPVWTGSCPCQPLSVAGQRKGHADERHLWPAFYSLIAKRSPAIVFGEQVASADGREWLAGIRADLENLGYAVGGADLCAAGVGAPHPRQRIYWMADSGGSEWWSFAKERNVSNWADPGRQKTASGHAIRREVDNAWMADSDKSCEDGQPSSGEQSLCDGLRKANAGMGDAASQRLQGQWREYRPRGERHSGLVGLAMQADVPEWNGPTVAVECSDGPRRVSAQPDSFPLAHGVSGRMGRLRAYGNAIVPQVAATFIAAALSASVIDRKEATE